MITTWKQSEDIPMKAVLLAAVAAVALSGSAFALGGVNGTSLNLSGVNGTSFNLSGGNGSGLNSPAVVDFNSLRLLRAAIRH
jgi:hypothetical protein